MKNSFSSDRLRLISFIILCVSIAALLPGCVRFTLPPPSVLNLARLDLEPLRGKIIVIDPGHGGPERGALGRHGLTEAEINLGVSLALWGLLKQSGARPLLTRTGNSPVTAAEPFLLKQDLQARADISNDANADLFISIHHNASAQKDKNDLLVFFKMNDPGRSQDIARTIERSLSDQFTTQNTGVRPGNYHVLRNTRAPAILGEASYLTNQQNEKRLALNRILNREAEGYFSGILAYYQKGFPRIVHTTADNTALFAQTRPEIHARLLPGSAATKIDPASIRIMLNGAPLTTFTYQHSETISFTAPIALTNGTHHYCIRARNSAGNISDTGCRSFVVALQPASMSITPTFPAIPADGMSSTPLEISVLDSNGRPVQDGTPVSLKTTKGSLKKLIVHTENGRARAALFASEEPQTGNVTAQAGTIQATCSVIFDSPKKTLFMATIRTPDGTPLAGTALTDRTRTLSLSDADGFIYTSFDTVTNVTLTFQKKGYKPLTFQPELETGILNVENLVLHPIDNGIFFGRKIVLDAVDSAALPLLLRLGRKLEAAGAQVTQTWTQPPAPSAQKRVTLAGKNNADLFLSIATAADTPNIEYYYKSTTGKLWADIFCAALRQMKNCQPEESTRYVLMHTAMPALHIQVPTARANLDEHLYSALKTIFAPAESAQQQENIN